MTRRLAVALLLTALAPAAIRAQTPEIVRAEAQAAAGETDAARAAVERWWREKGGSLTAADDARPRALLLRGRLATDPDSARNDFLVIVLEHPRSAEAPEALLRLGQLYHATGDAERAARYLARLTADHPTSAQAAAGHLWLARARRSMGDGAGACAAAGAGLAGRASDADLLAMLRGECDAACAGAAAGADARSAPAPAAGQASGRFAVQAGAFRDPGGARTIAARLRKAGYEPRIVRLGTGTLLRVRVGRFAGRADAAGLVRTLAGHGIEALVVDDVGHEMAVQPER